MFIHEYTKYKDTVLKDCEKYLERKGDMKDGVCEKRLKEKMMQLKEGKFLLAVVGAVKAGKSTLINALLGKTYLPTDVIQNTSSLIEIVKGEKEKVRITFANDQTVENETDIYKCLKEYAGVSLKYKKISVPKLNDLLIANNGRLDEKEIRRNLEILFRENNSYHLKEEDYHRLAREYLDENRNLDRIPAKIELVFPLPYEFNHLRIVDSPGVNAIGEIQDKTRQFIRRAHALLFVQTIEDAVENSSFIQFVQECIPEVLRECLFLVFSKIGDKGSAEIDTKINDAKDLFSELICQERILKVDSLYKIVTNELENHQSIEDLMKEYEDYLARFIELPSDEQSRLNSERILYEKKIQIIKNMKSNNTDCTSKGTWINLLNNQSNFSTLLESINKFSSKAPYLQLAEIYTSLETGYKNQIGIIAENVHLLQQKLKDPRHLEKDINERRALLDSIERKFNEFSETLIANYSGNSAIAKEILKKKEEYLGKINQADSFNALENYLHVVLSEIQMFVNDTERELVQKCNDELREYQRHVELPHFSFPKVDFESIKNELEKSAVGEIETEVEKCGTTKTVKKKGYSGKIHLNLIKKHITAMVEKHADEATKKVDEITGTLVKLFRNILNEIREAKEAEYSECLRAKKTDEQLREEIANLEKSREQIVPDLNRIENLSYNWKQY